jgi:hypothetical protein
VRLTYISDEDSETGLQLTEQRHKIVGLSSHVLSVEGRKIRLTVPVVGQSCYLRFASPSNFDSSPTISAVVPLSLISYTGDGWFMTRHKQVMSFG